MNSSVTLAAAASVFNQDVSRARKAVRLSSVRVITQTRRKKERGHAA
jgi:hypothetical protein